MITYQAGDRPVVEESDSMQVLFVEDDAMNCRVVRDMLSVVGVTMFEASDAASGLAMIDEGTFDLILMDLRMPGMDGLTAVRHLRSRADEKAKLPVIVVTADAAQDLRERCLSAGANDIILKPVAMSELFKVISATLAKNGDKDALLLS